MEILIVLIPLSLLFVGVAAWVFVWAANHNQFDDVEHQALIALDDEALVEEEQEVRL